ncbi:stage II sporulation protein M [Haloimpatiens lingqiaonensis]|uniref:stage II sporulation protein M n=1 Tax=Haloimpatiens lingqiaonensis TaxID=1380675 RepID=UPI0010FD1618|nr:stage II sporulation protein M [Haloimpatiens lingqiaonensis]
MISNVENNLNRHIKENTWLYVGSIVCILIGMFLGVYCVKYMGQAEKNTLYEYLNKFVENISLTSAEPKEIFIQAIKNILPMILGIWFLGLTVIGIPIILIIDMVKGFTLGFSISSLINALGMKGIWMSIFGLIPQNIIYIPCIVFISVLAMEFSLSMVKNRLNKQWTTNVISKIASYSVIVMICTLICFIGFFIEGYIVPHIIKMIL